MTVVKNALSLSAAALALLGAPGRLSAKARKEITSLLNDLRTEIELVISENQSLKTNQLRGDTDAAITAFRAQVESLTSLVEQQASYIHNNIKPVPVKATTISFLSKEQPDKLFGVYSVSPEWIKSRFGTNTYNHAALEAAVRVEAQLLGQKQIGHNHFSIRVIVNENMTQVRFSIATQPVSSITSIIPQHGMMYNPLGGHARCDQVNNFNIAQWLEAANRLKEGPYLG